MTDITKPLPGQERYVAPLEETPLQTVDTVDESATATSMWSDAWRALRRNPLFIISSILIVFIIFVALFPGVFTKNDPNYCTLDNSLEPARPGHPFGFDLQGCDVYSRVIYGTRTSLSVGILSTLIVVAVGTLIGAIAGFCGGCNADTHLMSLHLKMSSSFHQKERTRCTDYLSLTARSAISMAFVTIFPQAREETLPQPPLSFTRSYTPSSLAISAFKFSDIFDFFIFQRRKKTSFPPPPL